jgi:hypothetical protein
MENKNKGVVALIASALLCVAVLSGALNAPFVPDGKTQFGTFTSTSVDLSTSIYFPPIGNQYSAGACAPWAMVYYAFGFQVAKQNNWTDTWKGNPEHLMSVNWVFNKISSISRTGTDTGSGITSNGVVLTNWGGATMANMPYSYKDLTGWGNISAMDEAGTYKALRVNSLRPNADLVTNIINLLDNGTPVVYAMNGNVFSTAFKDGNKIVSSIEYSYPSTNHAQCIVGYDMKVTDDGEVGAFKVVNSWGEGFGGKGYYWLTFDTMKEIGVWAGVTYLSLNKAPTDPTLRIDISTNGQLSMKNVVQVLLKDANNKTIKTKVISWNSGQGNAWRMIPSELHYDISDFYQLYKTGKYHLFVYLSTGEYSKLKGYSAVFT